MPPSNKCLVFVCKLSILAWQDMGGGFVRVLLCARVQQQAGGFSSLQQKGRRPKKRHRWRYCLWGAFVPRDVP